MDDFSDFEICIKERLLKSSLAKFVSVYEVGVGGYKKTRVGTYVKELNDFKNLDGVISYSLDGLMRQSSYDFFNEFLNDTCTRVVKANDTGMTRDKIFKSIDMMPDKNNLCGLISLSQHSDVFKECYYDYLNSVSWFVCDTPFISPNTRKCFMYNRDVFSRCILSDFNVSVKLEEISFYIAVDFTNVVYVNGDIRNLVCIECMEERV